MLPGKTYLPEDVLRILRQRIWVLLVPFAIVAALTAGVGRLLPDVYRSVAKVAVVQQRVPEAYVRGTVTTNLGDRLQSITNVVLSRSRLEQLIVSLNLYPDRRPTALPEDIVQQLRSDLYIAPQGNVAFIVQYEGRNPETAMQVASEVAKAFISESLVDRSFQADQTNEFLEGKLQSAKERLVQQEKKLEEYKLAHAGELPQERDSNMQHVQNLAMQAQAVRTAISEARSRQVMNDQQLALETKVPESVDAAVAATPNGVPESSIVGQLRQARQQLRALQVKFQPNHPDIKNKELEVQDLEKRAATELNRSPTTPSAEPVELVSPQELARQERIAGLKAFQRELQRQVNDSLDKEQQLVAEMKRYQARIESVPTRESELVELMRDYTVISELYLSLNRKNEEAKISASLERQQIGERFELLEQAQVPRRPVRPNRLQINVLGMLGGLVLGVALIGLLEYRTTGFRTDKEVARVLSLPVLAVVPIMRSDVENRRRWWQQMALNVGLSVVVGGGLAILIDSLVRLRG